MCERYVCTTLRVDHEHHLWRLARAGGTGVLPLVLPARYGVQVAPRVPPLQRNKKDLRDVLSDAPHVRVASVTREVFWGPAADHNLSSIALVRVNQLGSQLAMVPVCDAACCLRGRGQCLPTLHMPWQCRDCAAA